MIGLITACAALLQMAQPDSLRLRTLVHAPVVDGAIAANEHGSPSMEIATSAGRVRIWASRHDGYVYFAAHLPDSTYYWGDDFVVSIDPNGSGGRAPGAGDRQWYLRRTADSSYVTVVSRETGRWYPPGQNPVMLGQTRQGGGWNMAVTSTAGSWSMELRVRESDIRTAGGDPRVAFRTFNDAPQGWWTVPIAPEGTPTQAVERMPDLWLKIVFD